MSDGLADRAALNSPDRRVRRLIPAHPPKEAIEARRKKANTSGDHDHTVANPANGEQPGERGAEPPKTSYRAGRNTQKRWLRNR